MITIIALSLSRASGAVEGDATPALLRKYANAQLDETDAVLSTRQASTDGMGEWRSSISVRDVKRLRGFSDLPRRAKPKTSVQSHKPHDDTFQQQQPKQQPQPSSNFGSSSLATTSIKRTASLSVPIREQRQVPQFPSSSNTSQAKQRPASIPTEYDGPNLVAQPRASIPRQEAPPPAGASFLTAREQLVCRRELCFRSLKLL